MARFWIGWQEPTGEDGEGDYRPLTWPLPASIPAYWCSGHGDTYATLCAVVDADDEGAALEEIGKLWRPEGWRFVDEKPEGWRPGDRFPWPGEE